MTEKNKIHITMPQHFDYGYPKNFGDPHFGLYQPVLDCFLLTVCDLAQAQEIKILASARYSLYVIDLTFAKNYSPNLIDNVCCENWTLSNKEMIGVTVSNTNNVIDSDWLIETNTSDPDVLGEKSYLQKALYHVKYCLFVEAFANKYIHNWIDSTLTLDFGDQDYVMMKDCIKKIKKILYLGVDLDQIDIEIEQTKSQFKTYYLRDDFIH